MLMRHVFGTVYDSGDSVIARNRSVVKPSSHKVWQDKAMNRDQVIRALKAHEQDLRAAGVVSVSLFGSTARGESDPGDVDIAVRLAESFSHGGFDYFGRLEDLEQHLSQLLGCKVDVVEEPVRKERFQKEIDKDRALAF
jgi:predicted nucleotidyltransferase